MYYPDELVEEVRSRNDIVEVISSYVRLNKRGSNYFGLCPFHNEKTGSFSVTPAKQMFYCFGCHEGGNVISFLQKYENYTFKEALTVLADRVGVELPENMSEEDKKRENRRGQLLEINKEAGKYYYVQLRNEAGRRGYDYLSKRGLSDETMKQFGLGFARSATDETYRYLRHKGYSDELLRASGLFVYREKSGMSDKFWNRVIFPIMDVNHRIIGFGGRVMGDGEPKYLNSPETEIFDKSRNLYGLNHAKTSKARNLIICEGYMDVISLHQAGFNQAVASLGTAFTSGHANLLARYARENTKGSETVKYKDILLCYDSDGAGVDAAKRALIILREAGLTAKVINMKPYKDPDEFIKALGADEFQKRIDEAENGFMFEIRMLEEEYDLNDPTGKTKFLTEVTARILRFEDSLERETYIEKIADRYRVSVDSLNELVKKHAINGVGITIRNPVKTSHNKTSMEDGIKKSQGMLINWISEKPQIYKLIKEHISENDFTDELYKKVAQVLFEQIEEDEVNPGKIITMFTEEEEQKEVARLFHESVEHLETDADRAKALKDLIIKVKENSLNNNTYDEEADALTLMIIEKQKLDALRNININLNNI